VCAGTTSKAVALYGAGKAFAFADADNIHVFAFSKHRGVKFVARADAVQFLGAKFAHNANRRQIVGFEVPKVRLRQTLGFDLSKSQLYSIVSVSFRGLDLGNKTRPSFE